MPTVSDYRALISGATWNGAEITGKPVFVTYSFPTRLPEHQRSDYAGTGFRGLSVSEQRMAEQALEEWADVSGIVFLEVADGEADINFGVYDFNRIDGMSGFAGFAYYPSRYSDSYPYSVPGLPTASSAIGGDIFLDRTDGLDYLVVLHEIGHAIGLKHPFETSNGHDEILSDRLDTKANTIMSYSWPGKPVTGLGRLDVDAVQHLYGTEREGGNQVADWSWNARTETLTQIGRGTSETILGISTADRISGNRGSDALSGLAGDDSLDGGSGNDTLLGGAGDDLLLPGAGFDAIDGGSGVDTLSYAGFSRGVTVRSDGWYGGETLLGQSTKDSFYEIENVIGTAHDDTLAGDSGANVLEGGAGADVLDGGSGLDTASYANAGAGVRVNLASPRFNTGDARGDSYASIEKIAGSAFADRLFGDSARNRLDGGGGNDLLDGGAGSDTLTGGAGADRFQFSSALGRANVDRITDFDPVRDSVRLDQDVFTAFLRTGALAAGNFKDIDAGNVDRNDRILYDSGDGALYYDRDGSAGRYDAVRFALVANKADLTAADFFIV